MGRHKGYRMSEDHKKAISEGHKRRHKEMETGKNGSSWGLFGMLSSMLRRN